MLYENYLPCILPLNNNNNEDPDLFTVPLLKNSCGGPVYHANREYIT